jgi:glutamate-1-semialdehyde 2,1-aminomutase
LQPGSRAAVLHARASRVMPGGNTRASVFTPPHPPYAARGSGCRIVDVDGTERIDFHNNYTALILGHADPRVVAAVGEQLARGICFSMPTEAEVELAAILCDRVPAAERIRFANSGTEAVMTALKGARAFTGRPDIAKFESAFHGNYDFVEVSLHPDPARAGPRGAPEPVPVGHGNLPSVLRHVLVLPWNDAEGAVARITERRDSLAAVILDPMPNYAGLVPPRPGFLEALRQVTAEHGILLIFDEILNFRLGYRGAQGRFGIRPDLTVFGKIIGGGFPVGAVAGRGDVMAVFDPSGGPAKVAHSGTATANPVTMVAGAATLAQLTPAAFDHLERLGDRLRAGVREVMGRRRFPGQVTGLASTFRLHLTEAELWDYRSSLLDQRGEAMRRDLYFGLLARGVLISPSGLGCLSTPMGSGEVDAFLEGLDDTLAEVTRQHL